MTEIGQRPGNQSANVRGHAGLASLPIQLTFHAQQENTVHMYFSAEKQQTYIYSIFSLHNRSHFTYTGPANKGNMKRRCQQDEP